MENLTASIREYRPDDVTDVERCSAELQDFTKLIYEQAGPGTIAPRYLQHMLTRCRETDGKIFVAESDGRVVGIVCVYARVEARQADEEEYEYAYISDLVILDGQRGKGLGSRLLERAEQHARSQGATLLRLNVLAQNEVARNLYIGCGFDELMVLMQKKL